MDAPYAQTNSAPPDTAVGAQGDPFEAVCAEGAVYFLLMFVCVAPSLNSYFRFTKHTRRGFPHERLVRVDPVTGQLDWQTGRLFLQDALEIKGVQLGKADPRLCLAVVRKAVRSQNDSSCLLCVCEGVSVSHS